MVGDIGRVRKSFHERKVFIGAVLLIYNPDFFTGITGSKMKSGIRSSLTKCLKMNPAKVSVYAGVALEHYQFSDISLVWKDIEDAKRKIIEKKFAKKLA